MNNFNDELDLESGVYTTRTRNRGRYHCENDDKPHVVQVNSTYSSLKQWKDMFMMTFVRLWTKMKNRFIVM